MLRTMIRILMFCTVVFVTATTAIAQVPSAPAADPLMPLNFLVGTWSARTGAGGTAGATAIGTSTFRRDLGGHALQRTGSLDHCTGPQNFDCEHHDQLTVFADANSPHGGGLYALYLDNEGHVIYYTVSTPDAHTAIFLSQGPTSAPHFRLSYHLEGSGPTAIMTGKFEGAAPGSTDFHPYLEWSGTAK